MKRILMALALMPLMALATTWYVDGTNGTDGNSGTSPAEAKATIQAAINASVDNDTILVAAGTYAPITSGNKAITIRSISGALNTAIDGGGSQPCTVLCESMSNKGTSDTVVEGFELCNGYVVGSWRGGAATGGTFRRCIIRNNFGDGYGAAGGCVASVVQNCLVCNNRYSTSGGWGGGALANCGKVYNCTIVNNIGYGVWDGEQANCIIYGNTADVYVSYGNDGHNNYNLTKNGIGSGSGNITGNPRFVDAANGDYRLAADSPCIDAGNNAYVAGATDLDGNARIFNGTVDIGCYEYGSSVGPRTYYVDDATGDDSNSGLSPTTAKKTIQAAIDVSAADSTILVAPGIYAAIATSNKLLHIVGVGGHGQTIIEGGNRVCAAFMDETSDKTKHTSTNTTIIGFTCRNGVGGIYGGTAYCCVMTNNLGSGSGWGIVHNCLIAGNRTINGGGCIGSLVFNSTIVGNRADHSGGGTYGCSLNNCIVRGNVPSEVFDLSESYHIGELWQRLGYTFGTAFTDDPHFVDAANGDYRLAAGSPCIDAGNNAYVSSDTDLDGNVRIVNNVVDIGCYEFVPGSAYGVTLHYDKGELEYDVTSYYSADGTNLPEVINYEGYSRIGSWNWWVDFAFVGWSTNTWGSQGGRTDDLGLDTVYRIEAGETGDKEYWAYWSYVHTWQVGSPKLSDVTVTLSEYAHTMRVSGRGAMTNGTMTTMARVDWLERMPWYGAFRPYIVDLTIDDGITAIGDYSFQDVGWLERVMLPSTLVSVGEGAFLNHHVVKTLTIPASVTYLADRAFATSIGNILGTVTFEGVPPSVGEDVFAGVDAVGFYPARYRAAWEAVIGAGGKWQGLTMICANMAGALTVNKTETLLSVSFNAAGSANIDGEEIAVQPELAEEEGFVMTEDSVILTVKTIPGYTYELLGAESVTGPYEVLESKQATGTTTVFETSKDSAKFFKTALLQ